MYRVYAVGLVVLALVSGCHQSSDAVSSVSSRSTPAEAPLISRDVLFGNPERANPQLSHDGTYISYLAPVEGVLNVWVGPADRPEQAKPVTRDTGRGIRRYLWAYNNENILYMQDKNGDENWRIYSLNLADNEVKDLTPQEQIQARLLDASPKFPDQILIGLNQRNPQVHDVYQVNIKTGERSLICENTENFIGFVTDDDFNVRFAVRILPDGGSEVLKASTATSWEPFTAIPMEDSLTTSPAGFDHSGRTLYMTDSRGRDTSALMAINLDTNTTTTLAEHPRADVSGTLRHPTRKDVQAVAFTYERKEWKVLDASIKPHLEYLRTVADGDVEIVDRTLDDRHWLVAYVMDDGPVRYYRYATGAKKAEFLFTNRSELEELALAKMWPVTIRSRDGMDLVSYYSLPVGSDPQNRGKPESPLPLVLMVHGGPWARDTWGYDGSHQWLANRGYAVLSVNFRGSTGFGKEFINAANMEWGRKMHDDLIDVVDWAVKQKIADPKKVAIMGGSYGGYAALAGLTLTPNKFTCAVDIVGPSNLITLLNSIPPYWAPMIDLFTTRVGDHRTEEGRQLLTERSPLTYVDKISRPLLIAQGANDPRVKQAESDQIVDAMKEKSIPVTYVLFSDEGHGFARPENRLAFYAVAEAFLAQHLGGRYEAIGDDFEESTIAVPAGKEHIPGLSDALSNN